MSRAIPLASLPADVRAKLSQRAPRGKGKHTLMTESAKRLRDLTEHARVESFFQMLTKAHLTIPAREFKFDTDRDWRFDYCWPAERIALEVEGGVYTGGRHTRPVGFINDIAKYNAAALAGFRVLRVLPDSLSTRRTEEMLRRCLK